MNADDLATHVANRRCAYCRSNLLVDVHRCTALGSGDYMKWTALCLGCGRKRVFEEYPREKTTP